MLLLPPSGRGNDFGSSLMRRTICASRIFISGVVGVGLGAVSGYFAGAVGFLIQKFVKVIWAFPALLLAIAIMAYLSQGLGTLSWLS